MISASMPYWPTKAARYPYNLTPEFQSSDVEMLLDLRAPGIVPSNLIADSRTKLDAPTDNSEMASRIAAFFKGTDHG